MQSLEKNHVIWDVTFAYLCNTLVFFDCAIHWLRRHTTSFRPAANVKEILSVDGGDQWVFEWKGKVWKVQMPPIFDQGLPLLSTTWPVANII